MDYILIAIGAAGQIGFGRLFVRENAASALLAGMLVSGGVVTILAWTAPVGIRWTLVALCIAGLILLAVDLARGKLRVRPSREWVWFAGFLLFFATFLRNLHAQNYIFESHDVLYFSPSIEMFLADYVGALRVLTYYPYKMAANHLLPSGFMASVAAFVPHPTLGLFVECRYFLAVVLFARFFYGFFRETGESPFFFFIVTISLLYIYSGSLHQELNNSSFLYVFVSFEILERVFFNANRKKELLFFAGFFVACKGPIFYSAGILALYFWWHFHEYRFHWTVILMSVIVFGNMLTWVLIPPPYSGMDMGFSLDNPFAIGNSPILAETIIAWAPEDAVASLIKTVFRTDLGAVPLIGYILLLYYVPFFTSSNRVKSHSAAGSGLLAVRGLELYMIISLFGWLLLRNGDQDITHQSHGYQLTVVPVVAFVMLALLRSARPVNYAILALVAAFYVNGYNLTFLPDYGRHQARLMLLGKTTLRLQDVGTTPEGEFYKLPSGEGTELSFLKASLYGKRILAEDVAGVPAGQIAYFIQGFRMNPDYTVFKPVGGL